MSPVHCCSTKNPRQKHAQQRLVPPPLSVPLGWRSPSPPRLIPAKEKRNTYILCCFLPLSAGQGDERSGSSPTTPGKHARAVPVAMPSPSPGPMPQEGLTRRAGHALPERSAPQSRSLQLSAFAEIYEPGERPFPASPALVWLTLPPGRPQETVRGCAGRNEEALWRRQDGRRSAERARQACMPRPFAPPGPPGLPHRCAEIARASRQR